MISNVYSRHGNILFSYDPVSLQDPQINNAPSLLANVVTTSNHAHAQPRNIVETLITHHHNHKMLWQHLFMLMYNHKTLIQPQIFNEMSSMAV